MVNPPVPRLRSSSRPRRSVPRSGAGSQGRGGSVPPPARSEASPRAAVNGDAREQLLREQMAELEADYNDVKSSELAARNEVGAMRQQVESRDEELRKLKLHILQLSDYIDTSALHAEEEKHDLRKQIESESRSYRSRNHNMNQLVAQLRQDALDAKVRHDELKDEHAASLSAKERMHEEILRLEKAYSEHEVRANTAEVKCSDMVHQRGLWETAEKSWVQRVERAELLVLEMEKDTATLSRDNEVLRAEKDGLQLVVEEQRLDLLQHQRKEGDVRSALAEASSSAELLVTTRRENEELLAREAEHQSLINELKIEKQKMMVHLQGGIRERQAVIDSLTHGNVRSGNTQMQLKIIEAEALKTELASIVQRSEEEQATTQEYVSVLKAKADSSEEKLHAFREDNRCLRAELELTKSQIHDVYAERDRATALANELTEALDELTAIRSSLQVGRDRQEQSLQEKVRAARAATAADSQSPQYRPAEALTPPC